MPTPKTLATDPLHLWNDLLSARDAVTRSRRLPMDAAGTTARHDLLAALEAYVACLVAHHRPIPYALRDELRLQQRTMSADRQLRYAPRGRYGTR